MSEQPSNPAPDSPRSEIDSLDALNVVVADSEDTAMRLGASEDTAIECFWQRHRRKPPPYDDLERGGV
jgi:hypothetical protein